MVTDDMNDTGSWAQGSKCYAQLRVVVDMNYLGSPKLKALDVMDSSGLWMIWTILGREHNDLDAMNDLRLWMT